MRKIIPFLLLILVLGLTTAGAYTVVLKNGKTMNGTLVSETEDKIIFKDLDGVQYSLKKANLDLARMSEANAPKLEPAPPPAAAVAPQAAPKKKSRVYTKEDVDALRLKYPELSIGEPIENPEDFENGVLKPEAYERRIKDAAIRVNESVSGLAKLREAAATAWEVAASTGKDPQEQVNASLATEEATLILNDVAADLNSMGRWQESMQNPPDQFKEGYDLFVEAMTNLSDFRTALREWNTFENPNQFRARLSELEAKLNMNAQRLQSWQAPQPAPAPSAQPAPEEETTEETETEPPSE